MWSSSEPVTQDVPVGVIATQKFTRMPLLIEALTCPVLKSQILDSQATTHKKIEWKPAPICNCGIFCTNSLCLCFLECKSTSILKKQTDGKGVKYFKVRAWMIDWLEWFYNQIIWLAKIECTCSALLSDWQEDWYNCHVQMQLTQASSLFFVQLAINAHRRPSSQEAVTQVVPNGLAATALMYASIPGLLVRSVRVCKSQTLHTTQIKACWSQIRNLLPQSCKVSQ